MDLGLELPRRRGPPHRALPSRCPWAPPPGARPGWSFNRSVLAGALARSVQEMALQEMPSSGALRWHSRGREKPSPPPAAFPVSLTRGTCSTPAVPRASYPAFIDSRDGRAGKTRSSGLKYHSDDGRDMPRSSYVRATCTLYADPLAPSSQQAFAVGTIIISVARTGRLS